MQTATPVRSSALRYFGGTARLMLSLPGDTLALRGQLQAVFAGFVAALAAAGCSDDARPERVPLRPVPPEVAASGDARLTDGGRRLELRVDGLPVVDGAYEVWLLNSVSDSVPLARVARGSFAIRVRLPGNARSYRWVDISRERLDGDPKHSGASVLRAPVARLLDP